MSKHGNVKIKRHSELVSESDFNNRKSVILGKIAVSKHGNDNFFSDAETSSAWQKKEQTDLFPQKQKDTFLGKIYEYKNTPFYSR